VRAFCAEVYDRLGATLEHIEPGRIARFDDPEKPRGNKACWAVLHLDRRPAGAFGCWRTGATFTWRADGGQPSREDRERTRAIIEADKRRRAQERERAHQAAAERARAMRVQATPATIQHAYLEAKRVPALGLRELQGGLLVPLSTTDGGIVNLQRIRADGSKRFLSGGRVTGAFWLLSNGLRHTGELYIAEGAATALTIHQQTRAPVAAAMNAGNLLPVAETIRAARPLLSLVVAADNDHRTDGNPGLNYGRAAARAVGAAVTWPTVCGGEDCRCTDYNDVASCGRAPV